MKKNRLIHILYWGIIFLVSIYWFVNGLEEGISIEMLFVTENIKHVIFIYFICILFAMVTTFPIGICYFCIPIANRMSIKSKLDKIDLKNDSYYRDILEGYSPATLSYIDKFEITKKDIVSTVLALKLKGKLEIKETIEIIDDNIEDLDKNEKYIFNELKNKTLKNTDILYFKNIVIEDCNNKKLLNDDVKDFEKQCIKRVVWLIVVFIVPIIFGSITLEQNNIGWLNSLDGIISVIEILCSIAWPFLFIITIIQFCLYIINPYKRSKKGKEINAKLEGLKKYIQKYSMLEEKEKEDLILWKEYLIYSVMFGINKKIVDDIIVKINNM